MDSTPHVILFADHTAKLGGGELALINLISHLDTERFLPVVVLASDGPLLQRLRAQGIETHLLPLDTSVVDTRKDAIGLRSLIQGRTVGRSVVYAVRLAWFARARGVDLIHTNSLKSDIYGGLAGRIAGIPVLWHVRDHINSAYLPRGTAAAFRCLARVIPQGVIANSESTQRQLRTKRYSSVAVVHSGIPEENIAAHMAVIHDGLNPLNFGGDSESTATGSKHQSIVILAGRIAEWKGQHIFLQAAAAVLEKYPETRFQIAGAPLFGEEKYESTLYPLAQKLGIINNVDFLGFREDISTLFSKAQIVVHASILDEPFGQVVIEGMAAGKPVIATRGGALPEIVDHGKTGLLVPMNDAPALAEAISSLLADPERGAAMGREGRIRVLERFTIAYTVKKVQAIYERMLARRRSHPQRSFRPFRDFGQLALPDTGAGGQPGQLALFGAEAGSEVVRATTTAQPSGNVETRGNS